MYDDLVYQNILWDREFSLNIGLNFEYTLEVAHAAYYKILFNLTFLRAGFGVQDILFAEEQPIHYCNLFYLDSRLLQTSLAFETNAKKCSLQPKLVSDLGFHWDSRDDSRDRK